MTIRHDVSGLEKRLYVAPEIETIDIMTEQAIMASSNGDQYGLPGEDPIINDFGNF